MTESNEKVELNDAELAVVEKTESRLAALNDDGTPDPELKLADEDKPKVEPTPSESDDVKPDDKAETTDDSLTTPVDDVVKVPDAFYRAAIHQGWNPADVDEFVKENPKLALKTLEKIYDSTNKISQEFARIGRARPGTVPIDTPVATKLDLSAFEKEYGKDDPGYILIKSLAEQVETLSAKTVKTQVPASPQVESEDMLRQSINGFFSEDDLKPYAEFYGTGKIGEKNRTLEQEERRWSLLEEADKIRDGANQQGIKMDVREALERGHLIVADSFKGQAIRNSIVKELKQKSKGLTLKPKGSTTPIEGKPSTEQSLENETAKRLASVKWN